MSVLVSAMDELKLVLLEEVATVLAVSETARGTEAVEDAVAL